MPRFALPPPRLLVFGALMLAFTLPCRAESPWRYSADGTELEIDAGATGQITRWSVDGRTIVKTAQPSSPLQMTEANGVKWHFTAASFSQTSGEVGPSVKIDGALAPDGDATRGVPMTLTYHLADAGRKITVTLESPEAPRALVGSYAWQLPLGLQPRKRVWYLSDYGFEWDTRYFYQLTVAPVAGYDGTPWGLLPIPDRNIWRHFALDQLAPDAYRLWKAAEDGNAPLTMHQGRSPAPVVQIYDEKAGLDVEYPALRAQAPKSLRVDADAGGLVEVQLWPGFSAPTDARRSGAFARQELVLNARNSEKAVMQARVDWRTRYEPAFSKRPDPAKVLDEPEWVVKAPSGSPVQTVTGGYPFAQGELRDTARIRVLAAGNPVAAQARPLGYWPDGSVKWAELSFLVDTRLAVAKCIGPRVTLRSGLAVPITVKTDSSDTAPKPASSVQVETLADRGVTVATGDLRVELGTGSNWLRSANLRGQPVVTSGTAYTDYLRAPGKVVPFDHSATGGRIEKGTLTVDSIKVEEPSPQRAIVRLEGFTNNQEPTRIVMRLEFLAGRHEVRISHTAVFRYKDARTTFLTGMGLNLALAGDLVGTKAVRLTQESSFLRTLRADGLVQADTTAPSGWLRAGGSGPGVTAVLRDFREKSPMSLALDPASRALRLEFWPSNIQSMDTRRYSDFLHMAQLESAATTTPDTWVHKNYYPEGSFYGVSCTHEALLAFDDGRKPAEGEQLAADFQSPPLLYSGWDRYTATGVVTDHASAASWPRMWDAWTRLTRFFLYHRDLHDWRGLWTFGDFQHRFRGGYGWIVPPEVLVAMPKGSVKDKRHMDNRPANDWCYDIGAYGWTNTEGLPNLFLQNEYLRHGNRAVYFAAEALARHSRDVIVRQEGPLLGKGTRHGVQPWSGGNHEERQTAATEWRLHYFLSGDGRTRDVIENLYQNVYDKREVTYIASHGGRLPGLLFHWELTGDKTEGERLARYVSTFVSDKGIYAAPAVAFPQATTFREPSGLNSGSQFLHTFGAMHALIEYQGLTGDVALTRALIRMADEVVKSPVIDTRALGEGDYSWPPVAFAALHADDPQPYRAFLKRYLESYGWRAAYQPVTENPAHWSGPTGLMTMPVPLGFFWANWAPYVGASMPEGEVWSPEIAKAYGDYEQNGDSRTAARPSWQSQFDGIPALKDYLGAQQPWLKNQP